MRIARWPRQHRPDLGKAHCRRLDRRRRRDHRNGVVRNAGIGQPVGGCDAYSWEKSLGEAVDSQVLSLFGNTCAKPKGTAALLKLLRRLQTVANLPIPPDPAVLRSTIANAFALPGGRIYVLSGLLKISETPDELAGVLSHELGHVAHRDGLRRLIRDGGTSFLVGLMFGDVTGSGAVLLAGRSVLSELQSR